MKKYIFSFVIVFCSLTVFATNEKHLVSYTLVKSHTSESIKQLFKSKHVPHIIMPVKNGVDIYEIIYKVKWIDGTWRNASGIYFAPKVSKPVPYMMFGHGTQIEKHRDISDNDAQQNICLMFATDGYAAMYPDYYGIGKGDGRHLYQHAWSEAGAFIYMLYAIDELNKLLHVKHNGQLFLTGYSQGGHASMAAHKYLEELNDPRFKVTASSPMSGAYDMTGEQEKYMFQEYPRQFYLPYLLLSYQEAYGIYKDRNIYSAFKSPFDTILPLYFENNQYKSFGELNKILPKIPKDMMTDSLVDVYMNSPFFEFKERLCDNNLTCWKPEAPMMLCYCKGDREVNYKNSEVAYRDMKALGAEHLKLNNLSDKLDHNTCAAFTVLATKYYFNRFRDKGKNPKMKDLPRFKKFLVGFVKRKEEKKYAAEGRDKAYL
jgi:alpha/beta superfamily hydrolase